MKYIIDKGKMAHLVGKLVQDFFPYFNNQEVRIATFSDGDDSYLMYYSPNDSQEIYAKYYVWKSELELNQSLFKFIEDFFGENEMTYVIDWFNKEFEEDAEYISH